MAYRRLRAKRSALIARGLDPGVDIEPCADCAPLLAERPTSQALEEMRAERDRLYRTAEVLASLVDERAQMSGEKQIKLRIAKATLAELKKP